jgi:hypothetical protein
MKGEWIMGLGIGKKTMMKGEWIMELEGVSDERKMDFLWVGGGRQ